MAWEPKPDSGDGVLFWEEQKRSERAPDARGNITLSPGLLRLLADAARDGKELKVEVSGWSKTSQRSGKQFLSLLIQMPRSRDAQLGQAPGQGQPMAPRPPAAVVPLPARPAPAAPPRSAIDEDSIPF